MRNEVRNCKVGDAELTEAKRADPLGNPFPIRGSGRALVQIYF